MWLNVKKWTIRVSVMLFIVLFLLLSADALIIGSGVRRYSRMAQAHFAGDRVDALIAIVECEGCDMHNRDDAVWALGQLGDQRAPCRSWKNTTQGTNPII